MTIGEPGICLRGTPLEGHSWPWMAAVSLPSRVLGRKINIFGAFLVKCILGASWGAIAPICNPMLSPWRWQWWQSATRHFNVLQRSLKPTLSWCVTVTTASSSHCTCSRSSDCSVYTREELRLLLDWWRWWRRWCRQTLAHPPGGPTDRTDAPALDSIRRRARRDHAGPRAEHSSTTRYSQSTKID